MYSNKKHIQILISQLKAHNIQHIVLCPGSRNIPVVVSIVDDDFFKVYNITDERSAGFFALGLIQALNTPVAICTTSGSAVVNLYPAITESYYQQLPLFVISADREQYIIDQMDGQTIHQANVFSSHVKGSFDIQDTSDEQDLKYINRIINEALVLVNDQENKGPVHLNVQIKDPFFAHDQKSLASVKSFFKKPLDSLDTLLKDAKRVLLIIGQTQGVKLNNEQIQRLKEHYVVIFEHISNVKANGEFISNIDLMLLNESFKSNFNFDSVISIGGHFVSKRLKIFLRSKSFEHICIKDNDKISDLFNNLAYHIKANFTEAINAIVNAKFNADISFLDYCYKQSFSITKPRIDAFNAICSIGNLLDKITNSNIVLANSSTVRYAQLFNIDNSNSIFCNRGVNGIDGSLSSAIGISVASNKDTYVLIGDLSFLYDQNALYNNFAKHNVKIFLINNCCGEIFSALPNLNMSDKAKLSIMATHAFKVQDFAKGYNFKYLKADNYLEFEENIKAFVNDKGPMIFEVFTNEQEDILFYKNYFKTLS